jgi:hypothetical protein
MNFWQQKCMTWRVGIDVQNCQKVLVLPDFMSLELPLNDLAKQAIVHLESLSKPTRGNLFWG